MTTTILACALGVAAYALGCAAARTPTSAIRAWERRAARLAASAPRRSGRGARALTCAAGVLLAGLGSSAAATVALLELAA